MASLTPREQDRVMNDLVEKFKQERLETPDAIKLKGLLEEKKTEAFNIGELAVALGITFLLAGLIGYLVEELHFLQD
jgi:hypothetical protein